MLLQFQDQLAVISTQIEFKSSQVILFVALVIYVKINEKLVISMQLKKKNFQCTGGHINFSMPSKKVNKWCRVTINNENMNRISCNEMNVENTEESDDQSNKENDFDNSLTSNASTLEETLMQFPRRI